MARSAAPLSDVAPPAARNKRPTWREPRILIGVALIAASIVAGARLMAAADDTVGAYVLTHDLAKGARVSADDLRTSQVRFADADMADLYVAAGSKVPAGASINQDLRAGQLLPRAAIDSAARADLVEVPISVESTDLPATVRQGSKVDVWVTSSAAGGSPNDAKASLVLEDVVVVAVPRRTDSLAPEATRQVIVGVDANDADQLAQALGALSDGHIVIARRS